MAIKSTMSYTGLAVRTGLNVRTLRRLVATGKVPHIRYSARVVRFDRDAIEAWLKTRMVAHVETSAPSSPIADQVSTPADIR